MKTLIVYYSLTGKTELIAGELGKALGGDVRRIEQVKPFSRLKAYIVGAFYARKGRSVSIKPLDANISTYDRIFIGTPVWAWNCVPAVNAFLEQTDFSGKEVVLFATMGGSAGDTLTSLRERVTRKGGKILDSVAIRTGGVSNEELTGTIHKIAQTYK